MWKMWDSLKQTQLTTFCCHKKNVGIRKPDVRILNSQGKKKKKKKKKKNFFFIRKPDILNVPISNGRISDPYCFP